MNFKKEMAVRKIPTRAGVFKHIREMAKDENAMTDLGGLVAEYTKVALIIGLVLVPIGLITLNAMNLSGMPPAEVAALSAIGIVIVAAIIMAILDKTMHKGKRGK